MFQFLVMMYAVVASFVLATAKRNEREARPHAPSVTMAGQVAMSTGATFAALSFGWVVLHLLGYAPEPMLPE